MMIAEFMLACLGRWIPSAHLLSVINILRHDDTRSFIGDLMPYQPE